MPGQRPYHHGHLRRAVIDAALEIITIDGTAALSLRDLARRAGVSHAAPAHHFKDKAGLLTAIAIEGHQMLADSMEDALTTAPMPLLELGVRYVRFVDEHPAHFLVMNRADLIHRDDPELLAAIQWTHRIMRAGVAAVPRDDLDSTVESGALAMWSLAHGFAVLARDGHLDEYLEDRSPIELFRRIAEAAIAKPNTGNLPS